MASIKIKIKVDNRYFNKLKKLSNDKQTMLAINNTFARRMDKYIPFDQGNLKDNLTITEKYVQYNVPYAHYMYEGIVYGPNIPITENGIVVGFYSIKGSTKKPKVPKQMMEYNPSKHPLATRHWDKAMLKHERKDFYAEVKNIIEERLSKL